MQDIKRRVKDYISQNLLFGQAADLGDHTSLLGRGVLDSTSVLELVGFLEQTFAIEVADQDIVPENLDSLEAIASYVTRRRAAGQPQMASA